MRVEPRKWYLNLPIRRKMLLWFIPLLVVTVAVTGAYSFRIATTEIVRSMEQQQLGKAKQAAGHLDYIAQDAVNLSDYLFLTPEIQRLFSPGSGGYVTNQTVIDSINRLMVTRPYVQFLTLYSEHFAPIQFNNKGLSSAIPFEEYSRLYDYEAMLQEQIAAWSMEVPGRENSIFHGDKKNKLLLTKVIKNNSDYTPEGILLLGIDELDIRKSYAPSAEDGVIAVIGEDGIVLSDSTGQWVGKPFGEMPYFLAAVSDPARMDKAVDTSEWVYARIQSEQTGWHVMAVQPRSELVEKLDRITWITVGVVCLTIVFSLFASWAVAGVMTRPIHRIVKSMKKFQKGNFSEQVAVDGQDELGQLGAGYNIMVQRIRELVDDVYSFELRQKQAELKLLQSQINPHFLYNTLNTIAWTAEKHGDKQVGEMIYSLSGIFKISLSQGKEQIPLAEEFKLLEHYLFLQKIRFPNRLVYEIELDPELSGFIVPKLLLQPLVENSVVHGIEPLTGDEGSIHVRAARAGDMAKIEITDNGVGIAKDKLEELRRMFRDGDADADADGAAPQDQDSFALSNISNRIRMFYGGQASIAMESVPGSGTRILLLLPDSRR